METEVHGNNYPRPPPDLLDGEEVYTVERILKHRRRGRGYQYYVQWEGYPVRATCKLRGDETLERVDSL